MLIFGYSKWKYIRINNFWSRNISNVGHCYCSCTNLIYLTFIVTKLYTIMTSLLWNFSLFPSNQRLHQKKHNLLYSIDQWRFAMRSEYWLYYIMNFQLFWRLSSRKQIKLSWWCLRWSFFPWTNNFKFSHETLLS